jgi:uncharacterized membrane protein
MKQLNIGRVAAGLLLGSLLSLAALVTVSYGADAPYKFKITDIPVHFTFNGREVDDIVRLTDLNDKGILVGNDFTGQGYFVTKNHKVTEIVCPNDPTATVSAINNLGQIVGNCFVGKTVGFVRNRNGNFTLLDFPGAAYTDAYGINDLGDVVGRYCCDGVGLGAFHGFLWKDGVYTTIDPPSLPVNGDPQPEAMATHLLGINNSGQIIGTYFHHPPGSQLNEYDSELAFIYDNGNFTPLDFPGAKLPILCCGATTFPMDINNFGQVVGSTYDNDGNPQLFLYDDGHYFVITGLPDNVLDFYDYSIAHGPSAVGINDLSEIAGTYVQRVPCDACGIEGGPGFTFVLHGFVANPKKVGKKHAPVN